MPVYIDQYSNVRKVMRKGIGRTLDLDKLEKQILQENINEVVNNQKYKYAAEKLSALLREQPSGLEEAIRRAEYVMKYKGAKFLKQIDIPLYQYLLLDVFATFLLLVCILTCFLYVFVTLIVSFIKEKRKDKTKLE
jgi:glucuronosyltransferase